MADLATPRAARLQRPSWRDARLVVGVLLIVLAMALGARVVAAADDTTPMYAAARALVPGQVVSQSDVRPVDVRLIGEFADYVRADHDIAPQTFALREVRAGELLLASALGSKNQVSVHPVTVPADATSAALLTSGSVVDVWVNARDPKVSAQTYGEPERLLESASVAGVPDTGTSRFSATGGVTGVQVLVPDEQVKALIGAIDQGAKVTLVPVPGSPLKVS